MRLLFRTCPSIFKLVAIAGVALSASALDIKQTVYDPQTFVLQIQGTGFGDVGTPQVYLAGTPLVSTFNSSLLLTVNFFRGVVAGGL